MNSTGIPTSFQLLGHTITVRVIPKSKWRHGKKAIGIWLPDKLTIHILHDPIESNLKAVFCHELTHAILDCFNSKLSHDEAFVDNFGSLLAQALVTFSFEKAAQK